MSPRQKLVRKVERTVHERGFRSPRNRASDSKSGKIKKLKRILIESSVNFF